MTAGKVQCRQRHHLYTRQYKVLYGDKKQNSTITYIKILNRPGSSVIWPIFMMLVRMPVATGWTAAALWIACLFIETCNLLKNKCMEEFIFVLLRQKSLDSIGGSIVDVGYWGWFGKSVFMWMFKFRSDSITTLRFLATNSYLHLEKKRKEKKNLSSEKS